MPYKDCERKEIVQEIVRRQAYRILKVVPACFRLLSNVCDTDQISGKHSLEAAREDEAVQRQPHLAEHEGAVSEGAAISSL